MAELLENNKTSQLLISGGDERLVLNENAINKYGCRPVPDDEILAFSSSTASPISTKSFVIADQLRNRLENAHFSEKSYTQEITRQKAQWLQLIGLDDDTQIIFSPSGTDLHRLIAHHVAENTLIIMIDSNETGSGVAAALNQSRGVRIVSVSLRFANSLPRPTLEIDTEVIRLAEKGIAEKRNVLIILADQSKTGMIAPSPNCAMQLKKRFEQRLNVLVDACQFRLSAKTLQAYFQQNFMIALTGSKFLAAPSFSAMLILPSAVTFSIKPEEVNFGLLLRMEIALQEYRAFSQFTTEQIRIVIDDFAQTVQNYFRASSHFEWLETPELHRDNLISTGEWDTLPTIFPFSLYRNEKPLSALETMAIYQQLPRQNPRCQVGQPVICGDEKSVLRLCLSAPWIIQAAQSDVYRRDCIEKALLVLKTLERII